MLSSVIPAYEADRLDLGVLADRVDGRYGSVDDVEDTSRETYYMWYIGNQARASDGERESGLTCALTKFSNHHRCAWIALGGLDDECVSGDDCDWDCPERDHPSYLRT